MSDIVNQTPQITVKIASLYAVISLQLGAVTEVQGTKQKTPMNEIINVSIDFPKEDQLPQFINDFKELLAKTAEGKKTK